MNLTHHFLIAMPGMEDASFARSVVYLCEHSERGALGLIINKPTDISLEGLFEKVDLTLGRADLTHQPVFLGGPVQTERGFVLHDPMRGTPQGASTPDADEDDSPYASTMSIPGGLEMTTSKDVLEALSHQTNFSIGCYCEDEARCHRSVLRELLQERGAALA